MIEKMGGKQKATDIYIKPEIKGFSVVDFEKGKEIIEIGKQKAKEFSNELIKYSYPEKIQRDKVVIQDSIYIKEVTKFVLIKNIIFPLAFLIMLVFARPAYPVALIMFLESAVPPITGISIHAQRHGGNASITNQFILASFAFSILSIPLMFNLFTGYFPMP